MLDLHNPLNVNASNGVFPNVIDKIKQLEQPSVTKPQVSSAFENQSQLVKKRLFDSPSSSSTCSFSSSASSYFFNNASSPNFNANNKLENNLVNKLSNFGKFWIIIVKKYIFKETRYIFMGYWFFMICYIMLDGRRFLANIFLIKKGRGLIRKLKNSKDFRKIVETFTSHTKSISQLKRQTVLVFLYSHEGQNIKSGKSSSILQEILRHIWLSHQKWHLHQSCSSKQFIVFLLKSLIVEAFKNYF